MDTNQEQRDMQLWKLAEKRAKFKNHLGIYVIMNAFFWALWFFTDRHNYGVDVPWPIWPMLGWGIGLAFNYFDAYHNDKMMSTEKEYEKLKREKEGK
jgi:hypothetical protein